MSIILIESLCTLSDVTSHPIPPPPIRRSIMSSPLILNHNIFPGEGAVDPNITKLITNKEVVTTSPLLPPSPDTLTRTRTHTHTHTHARARAIHLLLFKFVTLCHVLHRILHSIVFTCYCVLFFARTCR
jgi:hypothetical protein